MKKLEDLLIPICDIKSRFIKEEIGEENYRVMQEQKARCTSHVTV
jgi:hypothetical protein